MTATRRALIHAGLASAGASLLPGVLRAQTAPPPSRTLRATLQSDIAVLDPIWTQANVTAYHGAMVYDTLFGIQSGPATQAANGRPVRRLGGQAGLDLRTARRIALARRHRCHHGGRDPQHQTLGRALRLGRPAGGADQVDRRQGREDVHHFPEGAVPADRRGAGRHQHAELLHHAQAGGRDRPDAEDRQDRRIRSIRLQPLGNPAGRAVRLRQEPELRAAQRTGQRHHRRQDRQSRPRGDRQHPRQCRRPSPHCRPTRSIFTRPRLSTCCRWWNATPT